MRLSAISSIQTGLTLRGRLEPVERGGVPVVQMGDVSLRGIDPSNLTRMASDGIADRYFARSGDVLFRPRGDQTVAAAIPENLNEPLLILLPLIILRPNKDIITPKFLAWIVNQAPAQRYFDECARGTNMRMIPKSSLENIDLDIPDISTQNRIVEIASLSDRESALLNVLAEKKQKFVNFALLERVRKTQPHGNEAGPLGGRRTGPPTVKSEQANK